LKAVAYTIFAVVLGLALIVGPVYVLTATKGQNITSTPPQWFSSSFSENLKEVEGTYADRPTASQMDVGFFAVTFVVALSIYLVLHRKLSDREYRAARFPF
jgi:hypothetical protein